MDERLRALPKSATSSLSTEERLHRGIAQKRAPVTEVVDEAELKNTPYHMQGDASMNTADMLEKRRLLRHDKAVDKALRLWWTTAQNSARQTVTNGEHYGLTDDDPLPKEEYMKLSGKLYRALVGGWDAEDASAIAEEEWNEEIGADKAMMTRAQFLDSIFDLADTWVRGVDPSSYIEFIWMLFFNLIEGTPPKDCTWKPDEEVGFVAPAIGVYEGDLDKWGRPIAKRTSSYARSSQRRSSARVSSASMRDSTGSQAEGGGGGGAKSLKPGWRQRVSARFSQSALGRASRTSFSSKGMKTAAGNLMSAVRRRFKSTDKVLPNERAATVDAAGATPKPKPPPTPSPPEKKFVRPKPAPSTTRVYTPKVIRNALGYSTTSQGIGPPVGLRQS